MILSRYLLREALHALLAVTFVLMLIFITQQIVRYLNYVATGKIAANLVMQMIGFEIPFLLAILLPLALYLGILLAYSRLSSNSEMPVMEAYGYGFKRIVKVTSIFAGLVALVILLLMTWVNPRVASVREQVINHSTNSDRLIQTLMPGRFQASSDGRRVIYVERLSRNHSKAENIFIAQEEVHPGETTTNPWVIVSAGQGYQGKEMGDDYLVATNGYRYEGVPGQNNYQIIQFKKYAVRLPSDNMRATHQEDEAIPTLKLIENYFSPRYAAELQWRISLPLSALLLAWLAIPLSRARPRQGRYLIILLAILIYIVYVNLLFVTRHWVEQSMLPIGIGMWCVHISMLFFVLLIFFMSTQHFSLFRK